MVMDRPSHASLESLGYTNRKGRGLTRQTQTYGSEYGQQ